MGILILIGVVVGVFWFMFARKKDAKQREVRVTKDEFYQKNPRIEVRIEYGNFDDAIRGADSVLSENVWVPYDKSITAAGYELRDGLLYVGRGLKSLNGWDIEPALINPQLKINKKSTDRSGSTMGYWPSYSRISPEARAGYLEWLASGRCDAGVNIGYVFLYFYGLERRVIGDSKNAQVPEDEIRRILIEVKRLLNIYGNNSSFNGYASRFVDFAVALHFPEEYKFGADSLNDHYYEIPYYEIPFGLKYTIARRAIENRPLDAETAMAFIKHDPQYSFRTPATRCHNEFRELFLVRFKEALGEGCAFKQNKTRLKVSYRPASASFGGEQDFLFDNLPDVTALKQPWQKIRDLADECTDELDAYSRFIGRNPGKHDGAEAFALLPNVLFEKRLSGKALELSQWIRVQLSSTNQFNVVFEDLVSQLQSKSNDFNKRDAIALAQFLEKLGYGIEPDSRFFGKVPRDGQKVVLFKLQTDYESSPSDHYANAALMIELAAMVAGADGTVSMEEAQHMETHIEAQLQLSESEKTRLRAKLALHLLDGGQVRIAKRHVDALDNAQREFIGRFIAGIAGADNRIEAAEVKTLEKLYKSLGLDTQVLYKSLHESISEPVTVINAESRRGDFTIPSPPKQSPLGIELDKEAIAAKLQEAASVSTLLNTIFIAEDEVPEHAIVEAMSIEGLDPETSSFLGKVLKHQRWERTGLEALAAESNIMLDGTIDNINDICIESFGEPLLEGDETLEVNQQVAKELLK